MSVSATVSLSELFVSETCVSTHTRVIARGRPHTRGCFQVRLLLFSGATLVVRLGASDDEQRTERAWDNAAGENVD